MDILAQHETSTVIVAVVSIDNECSLRVINKDTRIPEIIKKSKLMVDIMPDFHAQCKKFNELDEKNERKSRKKLKSNKA